MRINTLGYFIREAAKSILRNRWMAVASISTVAISLLILGGALLWVFNTNTFVREIENNLEIVVFLREEIDENQAMTIGKRIEALDGVAENQFVTKDEAMQLFRQQFGERKDLLNALGERNPLPHMFKVKVKVPQEVAVTASEIEKMGGVELVRYGQEWIDSLFALTQWVRYIGFGIMALIAIAAIFLISTTIRLTVFARRKEIQIMRYVGATSAFIRWPFLIEGLFLGLVGALLATLVLYGGYLTIASLMRNSMAFLTLRTDLPFMLTIAEILIPSGVLIGIMGSVISMRKFLKA